MTRIVSSSDSTSAYIAGHGILVSSDFELAPGIIIRPNPPHFDSEVVADGCETLADCAIILTMMESASFFLEVQDEVGEKELALKVWNSLWLFPLLALGCHSPCDSLYFWSGSQEVNFAVAAPHVAFRRPPEPILYSNEQLNWVRANLKGFEYLQKDETFTTSLMCYTNSHHLFGHRSRMMQLWAGIECLFRVSREITRTLAIYCALLLEQGDADSRYGLFKEVKKAYGLRSKVVHGGGVSSEAIEDAYLHASALLAKLLSRCVELSYVPSAEELDRAALVGRLTPMSPV